MYRVQDSAGNGPYWRLSADWETSDHGAGKRLLTTPAPGNDIPNWSNKWLRAGYRFGFSSMEQLKQWFNKTELKRLGRFGYEVVKFQVRKRDVLVGNKQIAFLTKEEKPNDS